MPGGRVLKNETLDNAFRRLAKEELGIDFCRNNALHLGVYEHFYEASPEYATISHSKQLYSVLKRIKAVLKLSFYTTSGGINVCCNNKSEKN